MSRRRRRQIPLASLLVAVLTLAAGSEGLAQSPGPDETAPAIGVSGWTEQVMPFLGYTVRLPPGFERVGRDPAMPVPSSASIVDRDPKTGEALSAAAQRIRDNGGLFDAFGLWSIDPGPLLQLGILAGQPYRVGAGELRDMVEQSVLERASELEDPVVEAISLPAGSGFLAVYLDATDLAQHREVHLRTPTGRYLVLATTLPGLADDGIAQTVEAIAGSLRPIPESAADLATPVVSSADSADAALEATLPERIGGVTLTRRSIAGESLVSSVDTVTGSLAGELGRLVNAPGDVSVALAVPTDGAQPLLVAGYRLRGVTRDSAQAFVDSFPDDIWSTTRVAGKEVRMSVQGDTGNRTWLHVAAGPDGDTVLYQVDAGKPSLGLAAVAALP